MKQTKSQNILNEKQEGGANPYAQYFNKRKEKQNAQIAENRILDKSKSSESFINYSNSQLSNVTRVMQNSNSNPNVSTQNQTTSKKIPLPNGAQYSLSVKQQKLQFSSNTENRRVEQVNSTVIVAPLQQKLQADLTSQLNISSDAMRIRKRDSSQQPRNNPQVHQMTIAMSASSLERTPGDLQVPTSIRSKGSNLNLYTKNVNNISNLSTNPSSSQQILRVQREQTADQVLPEQSRQVLILNQRMVNSEDQTALVGKQIPQLRVVNTQKQTLQDKILKTSQQKNDAYGINYNNAVRPPKYFKSSNTFGQSRNSNASQTSNSNQNTLLSTNKSQQNIELVMATYGQAIQKSSNGMSSLQQMKNSQQQTKTSWKKSVTSQSHTDLKQMEIIGNNLHQRKSDQKISRSSNQQQIVFSKQKNGKINVNQKDPSLLAKKNAAIFGVEKKHSISQNRVHEEMAPDLLQTSKDKSKTPSNIASITESIAHTGGRKIVPMKEKTRNELMGNMNSLSKQTQSERKQIVKMEVSNNDKGLKTQAENTLERHTIQQVLEHVNSVQSDNIIFKTELVKNKRMNQNGPNSVSANRMIRGPKPEGLNNELSSLPTINRQNNKSEGRMSKSKAYSIENAIQQGNRQKFMKLMNDMSSFEFDGPLKNSNSSMHNKDSSQNVFGSLNRMQNNPVGDFQQATIYNNKSFDDTRDLENKLPLKKTRTYTVHQEHNNQNINNRHNTHQDHSVGSDSQHNGSYSSLERIYQRPDTQNKSVDRTRRPMKELQNESLHRDNDSNKYNGVVLAPLQGVREGFGAGPGTANTHGGPQRKLYKDINVYPKPIQFKLGSQQCQSELQPQMNYPHGNYYNNQNNLYENQQLQISNFDESFEGLFANQLTNLEALDPKDDIDEMQSISNVNVVRNQKSQGTYRQNHQKINQIMHKYHNQTLDENNSASDIYDANSQSNIFEMQSQFGDIQVQIASKLSQDPESDAGLGQQRQRSIVNQNETYTSSKKDASPNDEQHPFNGPKLHLFRKGQSKSSQMKSRKQKLEHQQQTTHTHEVASQYYHQQRGMSSQNLQYSQFKQLSEGGPSYSSFVNIGPNALNTGVGVASKSKNGHINISEILQENRHNGILQHPQSNQHINSNIDRLYNDLRSQNSQGVISQNSYEMQGPLNEDSELFSQVKFSKGAELNHILNTDNARFESQMNKKQTISSKFSTIQSNGQNIKQINMPQKVHTNFLNEPIFSDVISTEQAQSPYAVNNLTSLQSSSMKKLGPNSKNVEHVISKIKEQQMSGLRPNTTNSSNLVFKMNESSDNKSIGSISKSKFQHPKVGKNSKHPLVFKNNLNSQQKTLQKSTLQNNSSYEVQNLGLFERHSSNADEDIDRDNFKDHKLEPSQTGDFPSQHDIKQFGMELKEMEQKRQSRARETEQIEDEEEVKVPSCDSNTTHSVNSGGEMKTIYPNKSIIQKQASVKLVTMQEMNLQETIKNEQKEVIITQKKESQIKASQDPKLINMETIQAEIKSPIEEERVRNENINTMNTNQDVNYSEQTPSSPEVKSSRVKHRKTQSEQQKNTEEKDELDVNSSNLENNTAQNDQHDKNSVNSRRMKKIHSVAQTPCFAETPNTTDQFKGYKITCDQINIPLMLNTGMSKMSHESSISEHQIDVMADSKQQFFKR